MDVPGFQNKCYKTLTCTGGLSAPAGGKREREGGRERREGGRRAPSQVKCRHVRLTTARSSNSSIQAMEMLRGPRVLIHEYRL